VGPTDTAGIRLLSCPDAEVLGVRGADLWVPCEKHAQVRACFSLSLFSTPLLLSPCFLLPKEDPTHIFILGAYLLSPILPAHSRSSMLDLLLLGT
jgi:hypothetical protein